MSILGEIGAHVPGHRILTDPDVMLGLSKDQGEGAAAGKPIAVVRAESTDEVAEVIRACIRHRVPVVARGAGTGLSGGANAIDDGIVIALDRMNQVLRIDPMERLAVVQAGVVNDDLRRIVAEHGLWYPPDPASSPWSTIGGNVATNAGGICCVKYGVTRDYVLALEMVTGTGEIVRIGHRTAKGVAGYDLVGLVVGAEGTLGVVTEVTVRLRPLPPAARSIVGFFGSIIDAGNAVRAVADAGLTPSALELIDQHCLAAVDAWRNMGLSVEAEVILLGRV
ncbi:MAG TPA: FAD-binding protein, partial [Streptosporangiaceae bacterium]|nr:FAD-binding protein [Streptosporangiaceae bacterium]